MSPRDTAAVLRATAKYLLRHGWTQGQYRADDGACCLYGALAIVADQQPGFTYVPIYTEATTALQQRGYTVSWNDTAGRTKQDVMNALLRTAVELEGN